MAAVQAFKLSDTHSLASPVPVAQISTSPQPVRTESFAKVKVQKPTVLDPKGNSDLSALHAIFLAHAYIQCVLAYMLQCAKPATQHPRASIQAACPLPLSLQLQRPQDPSPASLGTLLDGSRGLPLPACETSLPAFIRLPGLAASCTPPLSTSLTLLVGLRGRCDWRDARGRCAFVSDCSAADSSMTASAG